VGGKGVGGSPGAERHKGVPGPAQPEQERSAEESAAPVTPILTSVRSPAGRRSARVTVPCATVSWVAR